MVVTKLSKFCFGDLYAQIIIKLISIYANSAESSSLICSLFNTAVGFCTFSF